jgi:putative tricarboxylic transport membrane protein
MPRSVVLLLTLLGLLTAAVPASPQALSSLKLLVPVNPGGGWDQTARAIEQALRTEKLVPGAIRITNRGGAGGTIGLAEFAKSRGEGGSLMVMGLVMIGAIVTSKSAVTLEGVTPIARLTSEYLVIAVPAASKMQTLRDFTDALRKNPGAVAIAGGSRGGPDHILAALVAESVGVPGAKVNYVAYAGGGDAVASLLGAQVAAGISGYGEFEGHIESNKLRALAISAPARIRGMDAPTLKEQGVNLDFGSWRGVVAPAAISVPDRQALLDLIDRMVKSATWKSELRKHNWEDAYLAGDAFARFVRAEAERVTSVVKSAGLVK